MSLVAGQCRAPDARDWQLEADMNKTVCALLQLALILTFPALLLATGNGDVTIKLNGRLPSDPMGLVLTGCDWNYLEIWIMNDAPLSRISIALSFDDGDNSIEFVTPNGSLPEGGAYVQEHGSAVGAFDLGGLIVDTSRLPDTLLLAGTASSNPLPIHAIPTLCYSLRLRVPPGAGGGSFYVDNIFVPPTGIWMFDDGLEYAPSFEGNPNSSVNNPDAQAARFEVGTIPCVPPQFTVTPNAVESTSHCSNYTFAFQAQDSKCKGVTSALKFFSSIGTMNQATGAFLLTPDSGCGSKVVTVFVYDYDIVCFSDRFTFTVNWIDTPVTLSNCPTSTVIRPNDLYEYPFRVTDQDVCDEITCAAVSVGASPAGAYHVGSNGKFSFTPATSDSGQIYVFDLIANSGCGSADSCRFTVEVGSPTCGDVNGDKSVNISDAVHLISYIFSGGSPPNPLQSGNVDCNTTVNLSDAVYLISFVFSSGSVPCAGCP
jgi:hypothetical protein